MREAQIPYPRAVCQIREPIMGPLPQVAQDPGTTLLLVLAPMTAWF